MLRQMLLGFGALWLLCVGCDRPPTQPADGGAATSPVVRRIAVIPKGTTHEFWKSVHAGAIKAERELGDVAVTFQGPLREDDREKQISLVQNFISGGVDAIVLAPLDDVALLPPVRQAAKAGIPVVIIDSGLGGEAGKDYASFVATDNYAGGTLAGRRMGELLPDGGRVLILRYQEGSASTARREQGFIDALAEFNQIELVDPKRFAGPTSDTAQQAADNLLAAHGDVDGIFCPNESSTYGMLLALRSRDLTGRMKFVGFDASAELVKALAQQELQGLVVQNPLRMGYLGVKTAAAHLAGEQVEPRVDTGVTLVTPESMHTPEHQQLLDPNLGAYLGS